MRQAKLLRTLVSAVAALVLACAPPHPQAGTRHPATPDPGPAGSPAPAPASAEKVTITFWTWFQGSHYEENLKHLIQTFEDDHPNAEVRYESLTWQEGVQKVSLRLAAGEPPDVMFAYFNPVWLDTGRVVPIDDQLTAEEKSDYGEPSLRSYTHRGRLYGFPIWKQLWNVAANRELLEEAGVDWRGIQKEGWTFEQFNDVAVKLTRERGRLGKKQWGFVYNGTWSNGGLPEMWQLWNANSGIPSVADEQGRFLYNDPRALENLRRIVGYHRDLKVSPPDGPAIQPTRMVEMFDHWEAAMIARSGPYIVPQQRERCEKIRAGEEQGTCLTPVLLPFPRLPGEKEGTPASMPAHIVLRGKTDKGADFRRLAVELARHLSSAEATCRWSADLYTVPARESGIRYCQEHRILDTQDPNMLFVRGYFDRAAVTVWTLPWELNSRVQRAQREGLLPSYEAMLIGAKTPEEAFLEIVAAVEKILRE